MSIIDQNDIFEQKVKYIILDKNTDIEKKSNFGQKWPDFKKFDLVRN